MKGSVPFSERGIYKERQMERKGERRDGRAGREGGGRQSRGNQEGIENDKMREKGTVKKRPPAFSTSFHIQN